MKKSTLVLVFITLFGITAIISTSCKKDDSPEMQNFIIKIDSIIYPDTISVVETLTIKFYGMVGPNNCYKFANLSNYFDVGLIQITTNGVHYLDQDCDTTPVFLKGLEYMLYGIPKGDYNIKIVQSDNTTLNSLLYVKE